MGIIPLLNNNPIIILTEYSSSFHIALITLEVSHGFTVSPQRFTAAAHLRGSQDQAESRDRQWATGAGPGELLSEPPNQPMIYL
jgi:hypothetical protein